MHKEYGAHYSFDQYHDYPYGKNPRVVYPEEYVFEDGKWMGPKDVKNGGGSAYKEIPWEHLKRENPEAAKKLLNMRKTGLMNGAKVAGKAGLKTLGRILGGPELGAFLTGWEIGVTINSWKPGGPMGPTMGETIQETLGFNSFWSWWYGR